MNLVENGFKICKLVFCGIYPLIKDLKIPFLLTMDSKNFSFEQNLTTKKIKKFNFKETKFVEFFKKIKISENKIDEKLRKSILYTVKKPNKKNYFLPDNIHRKYRFTDYAGIEEFLPDIQELIIWPTLNYRLYGEKNINSSKGVLFSGPPGCGKTFLVNVIAGELNLPIFHLSPHKFSNPISGLNEKKIQKIFDNASANSPSIIFIDEIDTILSKRDADSRYLDKNLFSQLLFLIDEIRKNKKICVILIGATNFLDQIDDAVRRPGRFDKEIKFKIPSFSTRLKILKGLLLKYSFNFNVHSLALTTKAFLSGDLFQLISTAASLTVSRLSRTLGNSNYRERKINDNLKFLINQKDLNKAKRLVDPGLLKNGFNDVPMVFWSDIGALDGIKKVLSKYIIEPIRFPNRNSLNRNQGIGILLYGPPGCGKTLLVNAVVRESGANFVFVKGPEILDKFLGESEKGIRKIFSRAKLFDPTIIFFDEFDSVASKRELFQDSIGSLSNDRIVNQLLTEIDSLEKGKRIYFIGATNRPGSIDKALLRPGRIDKILPVPFPNLEEKLLILKTILKNTNHLPHLNPGIFSNILKNNFTGAELSFILKEASIDSSRISIKYCLFVSSISGLIIDSSMLISTKNLDYGINKTLFNRTVKNQFS